MSWIAPILAQAENGGSGLPGYVAWLPFVAVLLIMYFLLIAPQRKKEKQRQAMLRSLEKNDRVVTIGGIHGIVKSMSERDVTILVDEKREVTLKMNRSAVYAILNREDEGELPRKDKDDEQKD
ncbi:MAG TPA: preprotein translocase subunit YajC [Planctomycetota bacterium]|nr:preprotein translocase subunit YajC [Planctomycetota bacterium]